MRCRAKSAGDTFGRRRVAIAKKNRGADDWLRPKDWSPAAQREFESKLVRSRRKANHLGFEAGVLNQSSKRDERAAALQLAELLLGSEAEAETREADGLLRKLEKRELVLPEYRFRHALASSRAAGRLGQKKRARQMARRALSLAEVQEVQLDRALRREIESFVIAGVHETSTHVGATRK